MNTIQAEICTATGSVTVNLAFLPRIGEQINIDLEGAPGPYVVTEISHPQAGKGRLRLCAITKTDYDILKADDPHPGEVRAVLHLKRNDVEGFVTAGVFPFRALPCQGHFIDVNDGSDWYSFVVNSVHHSVQPGGISAPQIFATIAPVGQRLDLN